MPGALDGVKVLDFTVFQQGPQATLVMADMGADVIKVEPPMFGDLGRVLAMYGPNRLSAYHLAHSRGKRSITLHLKTEEGREIARKLIPWADVMVHNFRPGAMEKLGLGYDDARALNERIIYGHASGWGAKGPKANHPAFDIAAQARSGLMSMTGEEDGGPLPAGVAIADYVGAMNLALAVVAALYARQVTGAGQKVETSLYGSQIAAQAWELQYYMLSNRLKRAGRGHAYLRPSGARSARRTVGRSSAASATIAGPRSAPPSACRSCSTTRASRTPGRARTTSTRSTSCSTTSFSSRRPMNGSPCSKRTT